MNQTGSFIVSHFCFSLSGRSPVDKWYKRHLTYQIVNWPQHLSLGSVRLAVRAAFQLWSNVSGLVFQEVPGGPADIRLAFYEGDHNDGASNAFDGPGQGHNTSIYFIFIYIYKDLFKKKRYLTSLNFPYTYWQINFIS